MRVKHPRKVLDQLGIKHDQLVIMLDKPKVLQNLIAKENLKVLRDV